MLIAAAFAMMAAADPAPAAAPSVPAMVVHVAVESHVSPGLVTALLAETDTVWRQTGITFVWQRERVAADARYCTPAVLHVRIGNDVHPSPENRVSLGWIVFDDAGVPEREIYLSHTNALAFFERSQSVVGTIDAMPRLQRETLLARAMGRALAHELGHYLSASKVHSKAGLMMAVHSAAELFAPERSRFKIPPDERQQMVARFTSIYMASRG